MTDFNFKLIVKRELIGNYSADPETVLVTKKSLVIHSGLMRDYVAYRQATETKKGGKGGNWKVSLKIEWDDANKALRLTPDANGFSFPIEKGNARKSLSHDLVGKLTPGLYKPVQGVNNVFQLAEPFVS